MPLVDDLDLQLWLYAADHGDRWPVFPRSGTFGHDRLMQGTATIEIPSDDDVCDLFRGSTLGQEFGEITLRAFVRSMATPVWVGTAIGTKSVSTGDVHSSSVSVDFEHIWGHVHRRRSVYGSAAMAVVDKTTNADNLALTVQRENLTGTVTPSAYPGGVSRTDYGSYTVNIVSNHSPALHGTSPRGVEQSGNNLAEFVQHFYEQYDLAPVLTDALTGTFTVDNDYPFEDSDLTDTVIFGPYHGNMVSFEQQSLRQAVANVWAVEGGSRSVLSFTSDSTSISLWGVYEAFAQKPQDAALPTPTGETSVEAQYLRDKYSGAAISYTATILETDGHQFFTDWFWRDKIALSHPAFTGVTAIEQVVQQWQLSWSGGLYDLSVTLGQPRMGNAMRHVAGFTGVPGTQYAGNRFRNKRQ